MNTKHTPAPWHTYRREARHAFVIESEHLLIARVVSNSEEADANAYLIAAAPELLSLLKELIDIEGPQPGHIMWATKVKAAIEKAEGR